MLVSNTRGTRDVGLKHQRDQGCWFQTLEGVGMLVSNTRGTRDVGLKHQRDQVCWSQTPEELGMLVSNTRGTRDVGLKHQRKQGCWSQTPEELGMLTKNQRDQRCWPQTPETSDVSLNHQRKQGCWSQTQKNPQNSNSNSKCIYSTHFRYNIILNLIYSKNNRVTKHALRHLLSLSYMPPFVFIYYTISIFCQTITPEELGMLISNTRGTMDVGLK